MHVPNGGILGEEFEDAAQLVFVPNVGQHGRSGGVEMSHGGGESLSVGSPHGGFIERGAERVEGDVDGIGIGTDLEKVSHDGGGLSPERVDKVGKVLDPELDEGGLNDFDLDFFQDVGHFASAGGLLEEEGEVGSDRCVDQDGLIEVLVTARGALEGGDGSHCGLFEHAEWVALGNELVDVATGQGTFQEEHDVLDHVFVRDEVEEGREGLDGLGAEVLEFRHQLLDSRLLQPSGNQSVHICQSVSVVRLAQVQPHVVQCLALRQVMVVSVGQK
mmetsp:Transcript_18742/g.38511  ORF Transcript_18742/g.38511 Transcript_18742/m.38511 type:complete len:274 (+) Transcript_18742:577-1398(+)